MGNNKKLPLRKFTITVEISMSDDEIEDATRSWLGNEFGQTTQSLIDRNGLLREIFEKNYEAVIKCNQDLGGEFLTKEDAVKVKEIKDSG